MLNDLLKKHIKEVPDFPKPGISFKDITPLLLNREVSGQIIHAFVEQAKALNADVIAGIDARGFLFGVSVAQELGIGFIPVRKKGKLPRKTIEVEYELEYGSACVAVHEGDIPKGARVLIHDDLLATGGTALAAQDAIEKAGGKVCGFQFIVELGFLKGREKLKGNILSLTEY